MKNKTAAKRIFAAAKKNDVLELLIYDSIGQSFWGGGVTVDSVKQKLDEAGDVKTIAVRINSPGGNVFDGAAIYSLLTQHKASVEVYVDGIAASAAFTIAMAGKKIHISEAAMMMCHNAWGMAIGEASDMRKEADLLDKINATMRDVYASRCGKAADEVQKMMDEETWMNAEEAVANGFADDVIKRAPDEEEQAKSLVSSYDLSRFKKHPAPAADAEEADDQCDCPCPECQDGDCANCSEPNCEDPNCEAHETDEGDAAAKAQAARIEVESLREEFEILSI